MSFPSSLKIKKLNAARSACSPEPLPIFILILIAWVYFFCAVWLVP